MQKIDLMQHVSEAVDVALKSREDKTKITKNREFIEALEHLRAEATDPFVIKMIEDYLFDYKKENRDLLGIK